METIGVGTIYLIVSLSRVDVRSWGIWVDVEIWCCGKVGFSMKVEMAMFLCENVEG